MAHQFSLEVKIHGLILVLPFSNTSTVEEIATAAYDEYQQLNPRAPPLKLLCVRDVNGRILSGKLNIIKHQLEHYLEVQVEEWLDADVINNPSVLDSTYRKWQVWTCRQVFEMITESLAKNNSISINTLSDKSPNQEPVNDREAAWIDLLDELCASPAESVQIVCLKSLNALRQKAKNDQHVRYATSKLLRLLHDSPHLQIVTSVMQIFQNNAQALLPLSQYHAEEALLLTASIDLDALIVRFPQHHASLVRCFNNMYTTAYTTTFTGPRLDSADDSLSANKALNTAAEALSASLTVSGKEEVGAVKDAMIVAAMSPLRYPVSSTTSAAIQTAFTTAPSNPLDLQTRTSLTGLGLGAMSPSRLLALLSSEDPSMRSFAVTKIHSLLVSKATSIVPVPSNESAGSPRGSSTARTAKDSASASTALDMMKLGKNNQSPLPLTPATSKDPFFATQEEVEALGLALFAALKTFLGPRPDAVPTTQSSSTSPKKPARAKPSWDPQPRAQRLIQQQLDSELCDVSSLKAVISCLMIGSTSQHPAFNSLPVKVSLAAARAKALLTRNQEKPVAPPAPTISPRGSTVATAKTAAANSSSAASLPEMEDLSGEGMVSQWYSIWCRLGGQWARLLITLSHECDPAIAEPAAMLAQGVLDYAAADSGPSTGPASAINNNATFPQGYGWHALQCKLDDLSLCYFLQCEPTRPSLVEPTGWGDRSIYGRNFRLGLALQWACCLSSHGHSNQKREPLRSKNDSNSAVARRGGEAKESRIKPNEIDALVSLVDSPAPSAGMQSLLNVLRGDQWDIVMRMWAMASCTNPPSRRHRRLAMTIMAHISALAEVQEVLGRARVLAKLLVFLASEHCLLPQPPVLEVPASGPGKPTIGGPKAVAVGITPRSVASPRPDGTSHGDTDNPPPLPIDLLLVRPAIKCCFNLITALPRNKQKALYGHMDDLRIGGREEDGGQSVTQVAQYDDTLMFYWSSLIMTVRLDAVERLAMNRATLEAAEEIRVDALGDLSATLSRDGSTALLVEGNSSQEQSAV